MTDWGNLPANATVPDSALASPPSSGRRLLIDSSMGVGPGAVGAHMFGEDGGWVTSTSPNATRIIHWDPTLYAVPGKTTRWYIEHIVICNGTNLNADLSVAMYGVTSIAGGSGVVYPNLATTHGSHQCSPRPTAGQIRRAFTEINAPAIGYYTLGCSPSTTVGANIYALLAASCWVKYL